MTKGERTQTLTESVVVAAGKVLQVPHPTGSSGPSPQGLRGPVVCQKEIRKEKGRVDPRRNNEHFLILAAGNPQDAQDDFWMWKLRCPQRRHIVCVLLWRFPKL